MTLFLPPLAGPLTRNIIHNLEALTFLRGMPSESVHCIVTSPPYWQLRNYGIDGQIGLEETLDGYIQGMVSLFREARRVLRLDGILFLNLGDKYVGATSEYAEGGSAGKTGKRSKKGLSALPSSGRKARTKELYAAGLGMKQMLGIPWRVAFALQTDGWILRADIIWSKPNPLPESVKDRPTKSHEYIFMLTKSPHYWYDAEAIKEPAQDWGERDRSAGKYTSGDVPISGGRHGGLKGSSKQDQTGNRRYTGFNERWDAQASPLTRNKRSVWVVPPKPFKDAHFATFPPKLIEPMILAGCPAKACAVCGAGWERVTEKTFIPQEDVSTERGIKGAAGQKPMDESNGWQGVPSGTTLTTTLDWKPTCKCNGATGPGLVLDMFMGSGTTAMVAKLLKRDYIGCDLNPKYVELARKRVANPRRKRHTSAPLADLPMFSE